MKYDNLCEMAIGPLMNSVMGQVKSPEEGNCKKIQNPVQPDDNIGEFGNENDIHIKATPEGGIEVDSKEMAFKLSSAVFDAIKAFVNKGEN